MTDKIPPNILDNDSIERQFILGSEAVVFGCIGILYGISLRRLRNAVGSAAQDTL
jgi:hypothetical protein